MQIDITMVLYRTIRQTKDCLARHANIPGLRRPASPCLKLAQGRVPFQRRGTRSRRIDEASHSTNRCARWKRPIPVSARWPTTLTFSRVCRASTTDSACRTSPKRRRPDLRPPHGDPRPPRQPSRLMYRQPPDRQHARRFRNCPLSYVCRVSVRCWIFSRENPSSRRASVATPPAEPCRHRSVAGWRRHHRTVIS